MPKKKNDILFLLPYPIGRAPSQRFRVEAFLKELESAGINFTLRCFMTPATWDVLYKGGSFIQKSLGTLMGFLKRFKTVFFEANTYEWIFIHREASPIGPPLFEWYLSKVLGKKIIYDFDDAIWIPNTSNQNRIVSSMKAFWKIRLICKWAHTVVCGNDFLYNFAKVSNARNIVKIPTVVDTTNRYKIQHVHKPGKAVVGWTGSHSTLKYLDPLVEMLNDLQQEVDFTLRIIADKQPDLYFKDWEFIPWNATTEIEDLTQIDIGLMPLIADAWSEGKCGFKLIQYLALGIPAVATPVGVNTSIIQVGVNGFLASDNQQWRTLLLKLIKNVELRYQLGSNGRKYIVEHYSIESQKNKFLKLFQ